MNKENILKLLKNYFPQDPLEKKAYQNIQKFLVEEPCCFDRSCQKGHFTASCWLESFDGKKALLTHHKKMGIWLQLGGHADGDHDLLRVSLKEAHEESGFSDIRPLLPEIFDIGVHFIPTYHNVHAHYHYDIRFLLKSFKDEPFIVSEESHNLRWIYDNEENKLPPNYDVKRMFYKWLKWKNS